MTFPDPNDAGFYDPKLTSLLRHLIFCGNVYWHESDSLEVAQAASVSGQVEVVQYMLANDLANPIAEMTEHVKNALDQASDVSRHFDTDNYEEFLAFSGVQSLSSLYAELLQCIVSNGPVQLDLELFNLVLFYESSVWFESPPLHSFLGESAEKYGRLLNLTVEYHQHMMLKDDQDYINM